MDMIVHRRAAVIAEVTQSVLENRERLDLPILFFLLKSLCVISVLFAALR